MTLYDAAAAFSRRYPLHPDTQPSEGWNLNCALLMARFALAPGGIGWATPPRAYGDAITVANNSGPLNKDSTAAPPGAWHYWNWEVYGHVGSDLTGGGGNVFMASAYLREEWGTHLGVNSVAGYRAANRSATYLGWATNYRGGRYNIPAGFADTGSASPITNTDAQEDDTMQQLRYIYVAKLKNCVIGYGPGIVTAGTVDVWNERCANWGIALPAPLPPEVPYDYYLSFLHLETGFPIGPINLDVTPQWFG